MYELTVRIHVNKAKKVPRYTEELRLNENRKFKSRGLNNIQRLHEGPYEMLLCHESGMLLMNKFARVIKYGFYGGCS